MLSVVSEALRVMGPRMDTGGDVGRRVNGSITSSRLATCIGKGGDIARTGDVYPEPQVNEWALPVCVWRVLVVYMVPGRWELAMDMLCGMRIDFPEKSDTERAWIWGLRYGCVPPSLVCSGLRFRINKNAIAPPMRTATPPTTPPTMAPTGGLLFLPLEF